MRNTATAGTERITPAGPPSWPPAMRAKSTVRGSNCSRSPMTRGEITRFWTIRQPPINAVAGRLEVLQLAVDVLLRRSQPGDRRGFRLGPLLLRGRLELIELRLGLLDLRLDLVFERLLV